MPVIKTDPTERPMSAATFLQSLSPKARQALAMIGVDAESLIQPASLADTLLGVPAGTRIDGVDDLTGITFGN